MLSFCSMVSRVRRRSLSRNGGYSCSLLSLGSQVPDANGEGFQGNSPLAVRRECISASAFAAKKRGGEPSFKQAAKSPEDKNNLSMR